jgi:hypothetical protein
MNAATSNESRRLTLLLEHCARLAAPAEGPCRPAASIRLEQRAGEDLARLLVKSLAGDHRRPRFVV